MADTGHLLDLAMRLRTMAGETHLRDYAMRMLLAAEELEHRIAANENQLVAGSRGSPAQIGIKE